MSKPTTYTVRVGADEWCAHSVVVGTWEDVMTYLHATVAQHHEELAIATVAWKGTQRSFFVTDSPPIVDRAILRLRKERTYGTEKDTAEGTSPRQGETTDPRPTQSRLDLGWAGRDD